MMRGGAVAKTQAVRKDDIAFIAFVLFMSMNASLVPQSGLNVVAAFWLAVRMLRRGSDRRYDFQVFVPTVVVGVAGVSVLWSSNAAHTVQAVFSLVFYTVLAVHIAASMPLSRAIEGMSAGFKTIIVASVIAIAVAPSTAFVAATYQAGAFKGLASHRNYMGYLLCLAALVFSYQIASSRRKRGINLLWLGASMVLVLLTRSATSLAMTLLWVVVLFLAVRVIHSESKYRGLAGATLFTVAVGGGVVALLNYGEVAEGLGRDATFTGRTTIWAVVEDHIALNPLFGHGWGAVWADGEVIGDHIRGVLGFSISHAHNGYLNDALQIGLVGAGLVVLGLCIALITLSSNMVSMRSSGMALGLVTVLAIASFNFVETRLTLNTGWLLFIIFYAYASRARRVRRESSRALDEDAQKTTRVATPVRGVRGCAA